MRAAKVCTSNINPINMHEIERALLIEITALGFTRMQHTPGRTNLHGMNHHRITITAQQFRKPCSLCVCVCVRVLLTYVDLHIVKVVLRNIRSHTHAKCMRSISSSQTHASRSCSAECVCVCVSPQFRDRDRVLQHSHAHQIREREPRESHARSPRNTSNSLSKWLARQAGAIVDSTPARSRHFHLPIR